MLELFMLELGMALFALAGLYIVACARPMMLDFILAGVVAAFLLGYLVHALIRPENF